MTARHSLDQIGLDGVTAGDEIVDALLANKTFVFDPATNFIHADDGGAPEHGVKYVPADLFRDLEERLATATQALGDILAPIAKAQREIEPGQRLNGSAYTILTSAENLREIARTALSQIRSEK